MDLRTYIFNIIYLFITTVIVILYPEYLKNLLPNVYYVYATIFFMPIIIYILSLIIESRDWYFTEFIFFTCAWILIIAELEFDLQWWIFYPLLIIFTIALAPGYRKAIKSFDEERKKNAYYFAPSQGCPYCGAKLKYDCETWTTIPNHICSCSNSGCGWSTGIWSSKEVAWDEVERIRRINEDSKRSQIEEFETKLIKAAITDPPPSQGFLDEYLRCRREDATGFPARAKYMQSFIDADEKARNSLFTKFSSCLIIINEWHVKNKE